MKLIAPDLDTARFYNDKIFTCLRAVEKANGDRWGPIYKKIEKDGSFTYAVYFDETIKYIIHETEMGKNGENIVPDDGFVKYNPPEYDESVLVYDPYYYDYMFM